MRVGLFTCLVLMTVLAAAGCASVYQQGQLALQGGRYEAAASHFAEVLAQDPDRLDALVGLGVARYKLGAYDSALVTLTRAATQAPKSPGARLYLALSYVQTGEAGLAAEHLKSLRELALPTRMAQQVERALVLLGEAPLSPAARAFVAGSLEDEAELAEEIRSARETIPISPPGYYWPPFYRGICFVSRFGHLVCY